MEDDRKMTSAQQPESAPASGKAWRVVPAATKHLPGIAACHRFCFPDVFASRMGIPFLMAFYESYLKDPEGFLLAGVEAGSDQVLGAVAGGRPGIRQEFIRGAIRRFPGRLACKFLVDSVVRRAIFRDVLRRLGIGKADEENDQADTSKLPEDRQYALLQVLCVQPCARGTGLAAGLTEAFGKACCSAGYDWMYLGVLAANKRGIAFYRKDGWQAVSESQTSVLMIRPSPPPTGQ